MKLELKTMRASLFSLLVLLVVGEEASLLQTVSVRHNILTLINGLQRNPSIEIKKYVSDALAAEALIQRAVERSTAQTVAANFMALPKEGQERLIEFGRTSPEAHEVFAKLSPEAREAVLLAVERHLDSAMLEKGTTNKAVAEKKSGGTNQTNVGTNDTNVVTNDTNAAETNQLYWSAHFVEEAEAKRKFFNDAMLLEVPMQTNACRVRLDYSQEKYAEAKQVFNTFAELTMSIVRSWTVDVADASSFDTTKVAVIILPEGVHQTEQYVPHNVEYVVKSVLRRLGPGWALQIFHGKGTRKGIKDALGRPERVIWTRLRSRRLVGRRQKMAFYNRLLWSLDFWNSIPVNLEHVLIFQLDSLVLKPLCVNKFLQYDLVGAPGAVEVPSACPLPPWENGGFTLRSRSAMLESIQKYDYESAAMRASSDQEDVIATTILRQMNKKVAPRDAAEQFAMETYSAGTEVCGFHQVWPFITHETMWQALSQTEEWHAVSSHMTKKLPQFAPGTSSDGSPAPGISSDGSPAPGTSSDGSPALWTSLTLVQIVNTHFAAKAIMGSIFGFAIIGLAARLYMQHSTATKVDGFWQDLLTLLSAMAVVLLSSLLINFNKYLMANGIFPFPLHLVIMHTGTGFAFAGVFYRLVPSMFPAFSAKLVVDAAMFTRKLLPLSAAFSSSVVLSNLAYLYLPVGFLQMVKNCNLALVYLGSLIIGLKVFRLRDAAALLVIYLGMVALVKGETKFNATGFAIQIVAQVCQTSQLLITQIVLSSAGIALDPMSYTLLVMPCCFVVLLASLLGLRLAEAVHGTVFFAKAVAPVHMMDVIGAAPWLVANCAVAFALNVATATFIKRTSAVAHMVNAVVKDAMIVIASVSVMGEIITHMQAVGIVVMLAGVFLYGLMQRFPTLYDQHGIIRGTIAALS